MPPPTSEKTATLFYRSGIAMGVTGMLHAATAPSTSAVHAAEINAAFCLSVTAGAIRTWCNPATSWTERLALTAASAALALGCVSNASGETRVALFATLSAATCLGIANSAMMQRLHPAEPAARIAPDAVVVR